MRGRPAAPEARHPPVSDGGEAVCIFKVASLRALKQRCINFPDILAVGV